MSNILVPLDFSPNAINALKYADNLAKSIDANLIVLNIYDGGISNYEAGWPIEELFDNVVKMIQEKTNAIIKENCSSTNISTVFKNGNVKDLILESIDLLGANFVVMGTHGASSITKVSFGSNTARTIAHSKVPVLAIPGDFSFTPLQKIVYASDFNNLNAELKLLNKVSEQLKNIPIETLHLRYETESAENISEDFQKVIAENNYQNIQLQQETFDLDNTLANAIREYAEAQQNIILAMFAEDRNIFQSLFLGSKTEYLTYKLNVPLLAMNKANLS